MSKEQVQSAAERKAKLLANKAIREKAQDDEREAYELSVLELEEACSEGDRQRGRQFEIIDLFDVGEEPIAVKCDLPGIQAMFKGFTASRMNESDVDAFVTPCLISPDAAAFRAIVSRRPGVATRAAEALVHLLGVKRADSQKKA